MRFLNLLVVTALLLQTANLTAGNEGHGRDSYAADFRVLGTDIQKWLETNDSPISGDEFHKTLTAAVIRSTSEKIMQDGVEQDVICSTGEGVITFCRNHWNASDRQLRARLVVHGILCLMQRDDVDYSVSGPISTRFVYGER